MALSANDQEILRLRLDLACSRQQIATLVDLTPLQVDDRLGQICIQLRAAPG
ncbi:hypothetical protein BH20ACT6_BH20ACT6_16330 [soil metagenome]